jgi:hypothetical protein
MVTIGSSNGTNWGIWRAQGHAIEFNMRLLWQIPCPKPSTRIPRNPTVITIVAQIFYITFNYDFDLTMGSFFFDEAGLVYFKINPKKFNRLVQMEPVRLVA